MDQIKKIKILNVPEYTGSLVSKDVKTSKIPPLGIAQITSYLRKKGYEIDQDDLNIKIYHDLFYKKSKLDLSIINELQPVKKYILGKKDEKLKKITKKILQKTNLNQVDMICLSASYQDNLSTLLSSLLIAKHLKSKYSVPIVLGGSISNLDEKTVIEFFSFAYHQKILDYLIIGPGEVPLYKLIQCLNQNKNLNNIPGLVYYQKDKLISQNRHIEIFQQPDFSGLPLELYKHYPNCKTTKTHQHKNILILPFQLIHGCPNRCIFCGGSAQRPPLKFMNPSQIVNNLKQLKQKYSTQYFFLLSSTINISKKFINELCDEIIKQKLDILWSDCARFNNLDEQTLKKMRSAGCIRLVYGLETASPRMLKYIHKGTNVEQASKILQLSSQAGIWNGLEIIAGLPTEKEKDIDYTLKFLKDNQAYIDDIYLNPYHMAQGSLLKKFPEKYGIKNIKRINLWGQPDQSNFNRISQIYSYDEIYGHPWEEKKKQITYSYQKINECLKNKISHQLPPYDILPFLFYSYKKLIKKSKVYDYLKKYITQKKINFSFSIQYLYDLSWVLKNKSKTYNNLIKLLKGKTSP